jgi:hypothetical protein
VTTPYRVSETDLVAEKPARGPCWDGTACRVGLNHRRRRKAGPPWGWVAVMRCAAHRCAFTVYPPGHVPYGPVPVVLLAPDGGPAVSVADDDAAEGLFVAALDTTRKEPRLWPRAEAEGATRTTQVRRVERGAALLGLLEGQGAGASVVAAAGHTPCGALVETSRDLAAASGLLGRGPLVATSFRELVKRAGRAVMDRLAVLGHLAGLWGEPYRWEPTRGRLLALGRAFWTRPPAGTSGPSTASRAADATHETGARSPP